MLAGVTSKEWGEDRFCYSGSPLLINVTLLCSGAALGGCPIPSTRSSHFFGHTGLLMMPRYPVCVHSLVSPPKLLPRPLSALPAPRQAAAAHAADAEMVPERGADR